MEEEEASACEDEEEEVREDENEVGMEKLGRGKRDGNIDMHAHRVNVVF